MADYSDLTANPSKWSFVQLAALCAFSSIGYAGMTSLPFYVQAHTGLFYVAFYLLLVLVAIPVCYVQIKLGALYRKGVLGICSHLVPILKGVAVALLLMTYFRSGTHAVEITYGVYYMFASCQQPFPWQEKPPDLNSDAINSHEAKITIFDSVKTTSEDTYFMQEVLQRSLHIGSWGPLVWHLVLSAALVWILVFAMLVKGSNGLVKAMTVLAPVTGVLALVVMVYGFVTVPDASTKLRQIFARSDLKRWEVSPRDKHSSPFEHFLSRPKIWLDALDIHVYGLGMWAGSLPFLGTHIAYKKKTINGTMMLLLGMYSVVPHLLMMMMVPYMDPLYPGGTLDYEVGIKPGMSLLFISIPHVFRHYGLSPFIAFLLYLTYVLIGLQHLAFHMAMIWENIWPSIPRAVMAFFKKAPWLMVAGFCFLSFLFTALYTFQCGIYLYQIIRHYVDRLLFCLVIYNMVPFVIGFVRQEALRTPIDRVFMAVWYAVASLVAACLLLYNFVVFIYPEAVVTYEQRWAEQMGWMVSILPLLLGVIIGAFHTIWTQQGTVKERIKGSIKVGAPPPPEDLEDDCRSVDTGDTDLKTPGPSRHTTPLAQARAPLLKYFPVNSMSEKTLHCSGNNNPTLFPKSFPAALKPHDTSEMEAGAAACINSPTAGRVTLVGGAGNGAVSYGTLQHPKATANVEVVLKSSHSDGNVARV